MGARSRRSGQIFKNFQGFEASLYFALNLLLDEKCSLAGEEMLQAHELNQEFQKPSDYFKGEAPFRFSILEAK
jgi:hypothetical protein